MSYIIETVLQSINTNKSFNNIKRYGIDVQKYFMYRQRSAYHEIQNEFISRCGMRFDTKGVNKIEKKTYCYVQKYLMSILQ